MKVPVLSFFLFFLFAIAFCMLVLFITVDTPKLSQAEGVKNIQGKVLGVSERNELPENKKFIFKNSFPYDLEVGTSAPSKIKGYAEPMLPLCSSAVIDTASGRILAGRDYDTRRPVASITKLAAMLVLLDSGPDWEKIIEVKADDIVLGGRAYVSRGEKLSLLDLMRLGLIASDNTAIMSLTRSSGLSDGEFVRLMNDKMQALGLAKTKFVDPVGISSENVSTAFEIAKLAQAAFTEPLIQETTQIRSLKIKTAAGRVISVQNTDNLLGIFPQNGIKLLGGKTGYTNAAGYCFVGKFSDQDGHELISVVLGEDAIGDRFKETKKIVDWAYANFSW